MITAIAACHDGTIAPALDFAPEVRLYDLSPDGEARQMETVQPPGRGMDALLAGRLRRSGAQAVVCGGISRPMLWMLAESGMTVYPGVSGPVDRALKKLSAGELDSMTPGGWRRRGRRAGRRRGRGGRRGGRRSGNNGKGPQI